MDEYQGEKTSAMISSTSFAEVSTADERRKTSRFLASNQLVVLVGDNNHILLLESLLRFVDDIKVFDDSNKCKEFLEQTTTITTFLVLLHQSAESLISQINHLKHIWSIHICDQSVSERHQLLSTESKMRLIQTNFDDLLTNLTQTIQQQSRYEENAFIMNQISEEEQGMTTGDLLSSSRIDFLDFLCYLPNPPNYMQRLITFLKEYYKGIQIQLDKVEEFAKNYRSENAIQWYTKDTFVYRLLNKFLRLYNVEVLFLFGFLIKDIQKQLKKRHEQFKLTHNAVNNPIVKLYRGQIMTDSEIRQLMNCRHASWLMNNSFLSATSNRDVALRFVDLSSSRLDDESRSVLFEIEVNTQIKSRPYSDISQLSEFNEEEEFLFTFCNQFAKINAFHSDFEPLNIVQLQMNYDYHLKDDREFIYDSQRKTLKKCVGLLESLIDDISAENINIIFNELLLLYPREEEWISAVKMFWSASINITEQDYPAVLSNYNKALSIWHKYIDDEELNCFIDIANTHQNLARCYQNHIEDGQKSAEKQYLEAIYYYKLALKKAASTYERMKIYKKLSNLEKHRMKLSGYDSKDLQMVHRYEELCIANMFRYYTDDNKKLGETLYQLAILKKFQFAFDESLINYKHALDIFLQLPFEFNCYLNICNIINDMVNIYIEEKNSDYLSAIEYELIKHKYILEHFTYVERNVSHARCVSRYDLAQSHIELAYKYLAIRKRQTAKIHLREVLALYYGRHEETMEDYLDIKHSQLQEQLADLSVEKHQYKKAYQFIRSAIKCHQTQYILLLHYSELAAKDIVEQIKYDRKKEKLEIRGQMLKNKMDAIDKLRPNLDDDETSLELGTQILLYTMFSRY